MRGCDLDTSGKLWVYRPESHKTEHHGRNRVIYIGPKAQEAIQPFLNRDLAAYLFSPSDAVAEQRSLRKASRRTPMTPSQARRRPKKKPKVAAGDHYTKNSYRAAIRRACDKAKVPRWRPNQLRHNAATNIRKEYGIEAARVVLGHSSAAMTEVYAEMDQMKAADIMGKMG